MNSSGGFFNKKIVKSACALFCAAGLLLSAAGCGVSSNVSVIKSDTSLKVTEATSSGESYRLIEDNTNLKKVASSGLIELYFDSVTMAGVVRETSKDKYWYALPTTGTGTENDSSVVSAAVLSGGKIYSLNSQDNSVAFGTVEAKSDSKGLYMTYTMGIDAKTAALTSKTVKEGSIWLQLTVNYVLQDGSLFVNIDMSKTLCAPGMTILDISLLDSFGAAATSAADDYILVPDGSGAIIKTGVADETYETLNFGVYQQADEDTYSAIVPAFGIKQGDSAFAAIISSGAELATITAERAGSDGALYNCAGVEFNITPYSLRKTQAYVGNESYDGEIEICYRFLLGNNAGYVGMAVATREQLIRESVLSTKTVSAGEDLPLVLSLIGKGVTSDNPTSLFSSTKTLTTYTEALDILTQLKSKGIDNIALRYKGVLDGGLNQADIFGADMMLTLGTKSSFNDLCNYVNSQNFSIFIETNVLSSARYNSFSSGNSAYSMNGNRLSLAFDNELAGIYGGEYFTRTLLASDKIDDAAEQVIDIFEDTTAGISLGDMGKVLYADFSGDYTSRTETANIISDQTKNISSGRSLMVSGGNFYMIKNANYISDLPLSANATETAAYESVPFVPMILHGIFDYSGTPINYAGDEKAAFLRSIEYGACPSFEFVYRENDDESDDAIVYTHWMNAAAKYYEEANDALSDLRDKRINSHYMVAEGVYCTEYSTGSIIYVNYTAADYTVNGVNVPSMDFVRIN